MRRVLAGLANLLMPVHVPPEHDCEVPDPEVPVEPRPLPKKVPSSLISATNEVSMPIYKVVEKKKKSLLKGTITAQDLEDAINEYASQGWSLDRILSGETAAFIGDKDVFLLIFKR